MTENIILENYQLDRIDYNDVKPGDIVCTYEPLSTNQKIQKIALFQNIMSLFRRRQLSRAFHFEIITKKFAKAGLYEIAHVDGSSGKVLLQDDDFSEHYSGQAFLLFRAKNPDYTDEIIKVAKQIAKKDNSHGVQRLPFTGFGILKKIYTIFRCFAFENLPSFTSKRQYQKVAQLAVDYENAKGFFNSDKTKHLDLTCPEYIANVLSVAKIRILTKEIQNSFDLSRKEQITTTFKAIQNTSFPFYIASPYLTSSYLANTLLECNEEFNSIGYLGFINEEMSEIHLQAPPKTRPISLKQFLSIVFEQNALKQLDSNLIIRIFQFFGIISKKGDLIEESCEVNFKVKAAFEALNSLVEGSELKGKANKDLIQFLNQLRNLPSMQDEENVSLMQESQYDLPIDLKQNLIHLEKQLIWKEGLEKKYRTFYLAMNTIQRMYLDVPFYERLLSFVYPTIFHNYVHQARIDKIAKLERSIKYVYSKSKSVI